MNPKITSSGSLHCQLPQARSTQASSLTESCSKPEFARPAPQQQDSVCVSTASAQIHTASTAALNFIDTERHIQALIELVKERQQEPEGEWYSEHGACMDFSARWLTDLQQRGLPVRFAMTQTAGPQGQLQLQSGQTNKARDVFHAFLVIETPQGELILDPTWKQFAADKQAVRHLPAILLGTPAETKTFYQAAHSTLQLETHGADPLEGQYEVSSLVELLYSTGNAGGFRRFLDQTETEIPAESGATHAD